VSRTLSEEKLIQLCRNGIRDDIAYLVSEQITTFRGVSKRGVQEGTHPRTKGREDEKIS
jgi:hypothetical protein